MSKEVTCKDVMHYVCECLAEDTSSEECIALKEHLDKCHECKQYFKSVELTIDCYRKYNVELPKDSHKKLMDFLNLKDE
jgi:predicted anti-sigma-YlaC factor YlaD